MMPLDAGRIPAPKPGTTVEPPAPWFEPRLRALYEALSIESPGRFSFAGLPFDLDTPNPTQGGLPTTRPGVTANAFVGFGTNPLIEIMWPILYNYCYAREFIGELPELPKGPIAPLDEEFVARLRTANHSRPRWDGDWTVYQVEADGGVHVEKAGDRRVAKPGHYALTAGQGRTASVGDRVLCECGSESLDTQPGFYFAFGETSASDHDDAHLSRFYFHSPPEQVPWILDILTNDLNRYRVPFRIKCVTHPALYERSDPMVLYVAKRFLPITLRVLERYREDFEERLQPDVPLCSKPLLAGIGAADEPGNGRSFGQTRSYILAQAALDAFVAGDDSYTRRLEFANWRFSQLGLSLAHPHLSEGSTSRYELPNSATETL